MDLYAAIKRAQEERDKAYRQRDAALERISNLAIERALFGTSLESVAEALEEDGGMVKTARRIREVLALGRWGR